MHLVALTHLFFPAQGGTEISLLQWGKGMVQRGHQVTVVTSNQGKLEDFAHPRKDFSMAPEEFKDGIRILRLPLTPSRRFFLAKTGALALRSRLPGGDALWFKTQIPHLPQMIKTVQSLKPDLIYAVPFPTATIYYASVAAKRTGCPWVIQPHLHEKNINPSLRRVLRWIFPKATALLTNTRAKKSI